MSPRPYQLGQRQAIIDEGRQRVIDAARALLGETTSYYEFSINAVATKADVARATIYYQFISKTGLLEALCDSLAESGEMSNLAQVFANPDPTESLRAFVGTFGRFWDVDRPVMRRLRALAALDPEVGKVIAARDDRRRLGLGVLVSRLKERKLITLDADKFVQILFTLTSFETFDTLAAEDQPLSEVVPEVIRLAQSVLVSAK